MGFPTILLLAGSVLVVFSYHLLGFAVLVGGSKALPKWVRSLLTGERLEPRSWPIKVIGLLWVGLMTVASLWVTAVAAMQERDVASGLVLFVQLLLMAGWTIYLWTLYRGSREINAN